MKNPERIAVMAALGLICLGASSLRAQSVLPMNLNIKLTVQSQDMVHEQVGSSPTYKSTIMKMRATNKDLVSLLEVAYGNADFTGYILAVDDYSGDFLIVDKSGNQIKNATADGFLSNFYDTEGDSIYKGSDNHQTDSSRYTDLYLNSFTFHDAANGNNFSFNGIEQWNSNYNGNNYKFTDSFTLKGSGSGSLDNPPGGGSVSLFLLNGSVSGKAKGID